MAAASRATCAAAFFFASLPSAAAVVAPGSTSSELGTYGAACAFSATLAHSTPKKNGCSCSRRSPSAPPIPSRSSGSSRKKPRTSDASTGGTVDGMDSSHAQILAAILASDSPRNGVSPVAIS